MRLPNINASLGILLELAWFAICAVEADPDVAGLEGDLAATRQSLRAQRDARNNAVDDVVKARALRAMALLGIARWLKQLNLDTVAAFGGNKKSLDYLRIFPKPPSRMLKQSAADRVLSAQAVLKALAHPATPKALTPAIKTGEAALKLLQTREAGVTAAQTVERDRIDDIRVLRAAWFTRYRSLESALALKLPNDADRVNAYFDDPPKAAPEASAPSPTPPAATPA